MSNYPTPLEDPDHHRKPEALQTPPNTEDPSPQTPSLEDSLDDLTTPKTTLRGQIEEHQPGSSSELTGHDSTARESRPPSFMSTDARLFAQSSKIDQDRKQFRDIVKGTVRKNLRKYISHTEMIGRKGKDLVSIPLPQLDVPDFRYGDNGRGGVGRGDGEPGEPIGKGDPDEGGAGEAGSEAGRHVLEVDISVEDLAEIMGEEMKLPRLEPKGTANIVHQRNKYTTKTKNGAPRIAKDTYLKAFRRQVSAGEYDTQNPTIIPIHDDRVSRGAKPITMPEISAAIIYIMDVSGSMTDVQKALVRQEAFWINTWIGSQYDGIDQRYIIHDARAKEVTEHEFFHTRESGGTKISSAYKVAKKLIKEEFPPELFNLYIFQFSDGDNWGEDSQASARMLKEDLLPNVNLFGYTQVDSPYGSGDYLHFLDKNFNDSEVLVRNEITSKEDIYDSIKTLFGGG